MVEQIMHVEGTDGQVELTNDRVVVHRKGFLNMFKHGINASHELPLSLISGIDFHDATIFSQGWIDFDHPGKMGGAHVNKNKVRFSRKKRGEFLALKERIFEIIQVNNRH